MSLTLQTFLCLLSPTAYEADTSWDDLYTINWIPIKVMRCPREQLTKSCPPAWPAPNPAGGLRNLGNGWRRGPPNSPRADPGMSKPQVLALTTKAPRFWASSTKHDPVSTATMGHKHLPPEQVGTSSAPGSPRESLPWRKMRRADSLRKGEGREGEGS